MHFTKACALAACVAAASAFKDTSPYILFSTSVSPSILPGASVNQLQSGAEVLQTTKEFLSSCPSTRYVIISQTDVHAEDFAGRAAVPVLRREMASEKVKTRMSVREVIKENTEHMVSDELLEYMISHCNAVLITVDTSGRIINVPTDGTPKDRPLLIRVEFPSPPTLRAARKEAIADNDSYLQSIVDSCIGPEDNYTIIYSTTPVHNFAPEEMPSYEADFMELFHMDLKRQSTFDDSVPENDTIPDPRPLFEKYQFFTPGLFMGFLVGAVLLSILTVAILALSSLQVSYGAFEKETGPKKQ